MTPSPGLYEVLLWLSAVLFAATTAVYLRSGRASMFHPATIYLAMHCIIFVLRPILAYYGRYTLIYDSFLFVPTWNEKITVIAAANLGLVVFTTAALAFGRAPPRFRTITGSELDAYIKPMLVTCVIAGIPAVWSLFANFTGSFQYEVDRSTGISISTTSNGYFATAQLMLATLTGMFAYLFRFRWWSLVPFALFVILRGATGGRGPFVEASLFLLLLYLIHRRLRWPTIGTTLFVVPIFILFRLIGNDRTALSRGLGLANPNAVVESHQYRFLESMDWANMEFFEYLVYTIPRKTGSYDYFLSFLQLFSEPIPRQLWTAKPLGQPIKLFNLLDYGSPVGMTFSLPGSGWYELGWLGVIIMCIVFAFIYGRAYNAFMNSRQSPFAVLMFCSLMMSSIVAIRDGQVITIFRESLFYVTPVLLFEVISKAYGVRPVRNAGGATPMAAASEGSTPRRRRRAALADLSLTSTSIPSGNIARTPRERRRATAASIAQTVARSP